MDREAATLEIKARLNIVDVVGRYIELERSGRGYKGLCPFHREKTPSFHVEEENQYYYCFGCHATGDIFSFVMHMEGWDFVEALQALASEAGVVLEGASTNKVNNKLLDIMEQACQFYQQQLRGSFAEKYLKDRGITSQSVVKFRLGFAPDGWQNLATSGIKATEQEFLDCGLIQKRRSGSGYYDRFRNRLIFPIFDGFGRPVAFGARALGDDKPKYLNSPEGMLFHKKELLYGWNWAKESVRKQKTLILVEGYMDVIACHEAGINNVVATMGTALTEEQIEIFSKQTNKVILAYDADAAGQMANRRGVMMLLRYGFDILAANFPVGFDPDDVLRKLGPDSLKEAIDSAENYLNRTIRQSAANNDLSKVGSKTKFLRDIAPLINEIPSRALQEEYLHKLSEITSLSYYAVEKEVLQKTSKEYERGRSRYNNKVVSPSASDLTVDVYEEAERDFVATVFGDPSYINEAMEIGFELDWLENDGLRNILKGVLMPSDSLSVPFNRDSVELIRELAERMEKIDEKRFRDCLRKLAERHIYRQIEELSIAVTKSNESVFYFEALIELRELMIQVVNLSEL